MLFRSTLLAVGALCAGLAPAQDHWARRVGAWSNDAFNDIAIDAQGFLYVAGEFGGNINLPGATLISQGSLDAVVAKYAANGTLLWARTFGGPGLDRAIKLELTADGHIAVVGQFMGSVSFGGQPLVSLGGTQDCFVLKMAQADGAVQWARRGGSANGVDQPNGVSVGPDGSIAVAGEFRGTAVFDQGTLTSITDPVTGQPSVDIFLATYAADGAPLWLVHGAAEFADRGMDVEHDAAGNVYLTGQFTDTLTLAGNVHGNAMYSAVFLARFSPGGQEEWFRVFGGGTYNQVFEMLLVEDSYLMLVGDAQGTVIFLDSEPDLFTVAAPRSSFLLKVGLDGELIAQRTWGSEHPINTRALSVLDNDIAVLGRFTCQLTGFTAQYGESSFLASGTWDLYVARFQLNDLDFKHAQQFAGLYEKIPGGIVHAADGEAVFCGAFEHGLFFPADAGFDAQPAAQAVTASQPSGYCSDGDYSVYLALRGASLKDAFLARGYVDGREPHDPYARSGGNCDRAFRPPAIRIGELGAYGPDSLSRCHVATLKAHTFTTFTPDTAVRHNAPDFRFLWSTGSTLQQINVTTSGWYWVEVSIGQQCLTWRDSLHVTINPLPPQPLINDDVVVNTEAVAAAPIDVCVPPLPWVWATNLDPANTVQWIMGGGVIADNDSMQPPASGNYIVEVTTPAGCWRINTVTITLNPDLELPPYDLALLTSYPQDTDFDDTLRLCAGQQVQLFSQAVLYLNGQPVDLLPGLRTLRRCTPNSPWSVLPEGATAFTCYYGMGTEGWRTHTVGFAVTNAPCGTDTLFINRTDSIYVVPLPVVQPQLYATGPPFICPGDTVAIVGGCTNCADAGWSTAGVLAISGDTAWVIQAGGFAYQGTAIDTNGCANSGSFGVSIAWNPLPTLYVDPLDGIICPNDSALIWTNAPGGDWQWYGPLGPLAILNDSIHTSQQGFYYLEMTDTLGCRVTSHPILVTDYATPFLNVLPDNVICEPGETTILQVVTTSQSTLLWEAPFAGSGALQQTVTQPGIYTVSVNACAITTVLSVEVFGNMANAALEVPGPFTLCPGEAVTLQAAPGQVLYYWEPGPVFGTAITTDTSGTWLLVVSDPYGCRDSLWTSVTVLPPYDALALVDTAFCLGEPMIAVVSGAPSITWYGDAGQSQVIGTGNTLDLGVAQQGATVWVEQVVGQCGSGLIAVDLVVSTPPETPLLAGPFTACLGDGLTVAPLNPTATAYVWVTPQGTVIGPLLTIDPVTMAAAGAYTVQAVNPGCDPAVAAFTVAVNAPLPLSIGGDTLICPGGTANYALPEGFTQPLWNGSGTQGQFSTGEAGAVVVAALDANGCAAGDTAWVSLFAFGQPMTVTGSSICLGQSATLSAAGSGTFAWFADAALSQQVHAGASWTFDSPSSSTTYYVVQNEGPCASAAQPVELVVTPVPVAVTVEGPPVICLGSGFELHLVGDGPLNGAWTTPAGGASGPVLTVSAAGLDDAGLYTVVPFIGGCAGDTLSYPVAVAVPVPFNLGADTAFCDGGSITLQLPAGYTSPQWSTGAGTMSISVSEAGVYSVSALDAQGCPVSDAIVLATMGCDPVIPNVITPNGDGWNDGWQLPPGGFTDADLRVWNRWGQLVWQGDVLRGAFRGLHANGEPLSEGTYFYELLLTRADGEVKPYTGHLTLAR